MEVARPRWETDQRIFLADLYGRRRPSAVAHGYLGHVAPRLERDGLGERAFRRDGMEAQSFAAMAVVARLPKVS